MRILSAYSVLALTRAQLASNFHRLVVLALPLFFLFLLLSTSSSVLATGPTILYTQPGGATSGACSDWASACDLQYALTNAVAPAEIWVIKGTSTPSESGDVTATFQLKSGVALYGGFSGTETTRGQRNWQQNVTILSGNVGGGQNSYHVVNGTDADSTTILDGFTVTGGDAEGSSSTFEDRGGGMFVESGNPTLSNVTFSQNYAFYGGGLSSFGNPSLTNVTFSGNDTMFQGGGMENGGTATLTNVAFTNNGSADIDGGGLANYGNAILANVKFTSNEAYQGGGLYNSGNIKLTNVTFSSNQANGGGGMFDDSLSTATLVNVSFTGNSGGNGGGMYNFPNASPMLTNVTFNSNSATFGGGMANGNSSNPTLTNVTFRNNSASLGGGMINDESSPILYNVTFSGNQANACGGGGGIANGGASNPTLTNVTFYGNRATNACGGGGGMFNGDSSSPTLTNVTFSGNSAPNGPGGAIDNESSNRMTIRNSIFWGNVASSGSQIHEGGAVPTSISASVVQRGCPSGSSCSGIITTDPHLQPLASNGGATQTMALGAGSSAINKGNRTFCPATDQRGKPRRAAHGFCDIGAYEAQPTTITATSGTLQSALINQPFPKLLIVAVRDAFGNSLGGVVVTYTAPASGASAKLQGNPTATNAQGLASTKATANGIRGKYQVTSRVLGVTSVAVFRLTNR